MAKYMFCVCDGTEMVKTISVTWDDLGSTDFAPLFLQMLWKNDTTGLWRWMKEEMTINEWIDVLFREQAIGLMLDDNEWHVCRVSECGEVSWGVLDK